MTKDSVAMEALAARVEALTGPDRDIDREIAPLVGIRIKDEGHPLGICYYDANGHGVPLPAFTRSIDAAMTLKGDSAVLITLSEINGDGMPYCVLGNPGNCALFEAVADTPVLALCAAGVRARAQDGGAS